MEGGRRDFGEVVEIMEGGRRDLKLEEELLTTSTMPSLSDWPRFGSIVPLEM